MKISEVLLDAAEKIDDNQNSACCYAIDRDDSGRKAETFFKNLFEPRYDDIQEKRVRCGGSWMRYFDESVRGAKQSRVLALLFTREIAIRQKE